jgi:hypothetical protein
LSIVLSAAMEYLKAKPVDPVEVKEFENACGVGVKITPDQIEECVSISLSDPFMLLHFAFKCQIKCNSP